MTPDIEIEIYRGKKKARQVWRWRATDAANGKKMANGGEAYVNRQDCVDALTALFGPQSTAVLSWPDGQAVVRQGLPEAPCEHCGHSVVVHLDEQGCDWCECVRHWVAAA